MVINETAVFVAATCIMGGLLSWSECDWSEGGLEPKSCYCSLFGVGGCDCSGNIASFNQYYGDLDDIHLMPRREPVRSGARSGRSGALIVFASSRDAEKCQRDNWPAFRFCLGHGPLSFVVAAFLSSAFFCFAPCWIKWNT